MFPFSSITERIWSAFTWRWSGSQVSTTSQEPHWWKTAIVYQVWPASFKDSNGDGLGDIPGIISKLDYIKDLGVNVVWLSPMYASPQVDMGYDISDYENVYPPYGTLEDMDNLIKGLHDRGIKLLLDLVVNHTSDQHKWFLESRESRDNPKAEWYIWKNPKFDSDGTRQPPNNWGSVFGGSAWEYVASRDQYYLHLFTKEQPDLNWELPEVRNAVHESAMHFWFKKGVDGFRVDTANLYSKVQTFPDGEVSDRNPPYGNFNPYSSNGPRIHEFYQEIRKKVFDHYEDPMMVGELPGSSLEEILKYLTTGELSMVFDFDVVTLGGNITLPKHLVTKYKLPELKTALKKTQDLVANTAAWSTVFLENHDNPRSVSRHATDEPKYWARAAKVLAMLLGTLSGTLFLYQGEEIGMTNIPSTWTPADLKDVDALNYWNEMVSKHPDDKELLARAWAGIIATGRDNSRTPVQWTGGKNAGFTSGDKPWMRINDNYERINVESQLEDKDSILAFWRKMVKLRKEHVGLFIKGGYHVSDFANEKTFVFQKKMVAEGKYDGDVADIALVALNFSKEKQQITIPSDLRHKNLELLIANVEDTAKVTGHTLELGPWEGRVWLVKDKKEDGDEEDDFVLV